MCRHQHRRIHTASTKSCRNAEDGFARGVDTPSCACGCNGFERDSGRLPEPNSICGYVQVPLDRKKPQGTKIDVYFEQ